VTTLSVEIRNESTVKVDEVELVALGRHVLAELDVNPQAELFIRLVDADEMAKLHLQYMNESGPTDVIAFPMDELRPGRGDEERGPDPALLGDVVLCPSIAITQAREVGHSPQDELHLLCAHGVLHLLGYDHGDADEERQMFTVQAKVLESWQRARR
jgi:probable rRNA maturation factor